MADLRTSSRPPRNPEREAAIEAFLTKFADCPDRDLLAEMMITVCRLAKDRTGRGELKLLSRALKELRYAFKIFRPYSDIRKVSIFGSSRTPIGAPEYVQADRFARRIRESNWMIITGAGDGIMRAGHHGATRQKSFGVAISLPFEQVTNAIIADDSKLVNFKYFFTRKLIFVKEAEAIVLFPGGFGTQDECFEAVTLVQTAKTTPIPIVMCEEPGGTYWQHWLQYIRAELLGHGMIDSTDLQLFQVFDHAEDAAAAVVNFYRRYHSLRYVDDRLVLRLNSPLSAETLSQINGRFADILTGGRFEPAAGPIEGEHGVFPDKPRLVFSFDRRSTGRLRALIDAINAAP